MDIATLVAAITAGATIAGAEAVKDATKDAYQGLKGAMAAALGRRAERAIAKVEAAPEEAEARSELVTLAHSLPVEDEPDVERHFLALLGAFKADPAVKPLVESVARIKLDVDAGGHVTLEYLEGARELDVKATAGGDFTLRGVKMDSGPDAGN